LGRSLVIALALVVGLLSVAQPVRAAAPQRKVAIIVGPVGASLTPAFLAFAELAATRAEAAGASVARAYSPEATPDRVLAAVRDADIVVYFGHGVGVPNPYSSQPNPETVDGWGLQGPNAHGDHADSWRDGTLKYYGEAWIARHARPAPGWVMIYSNACYAPGAGEHDQPPATRAQAVSRLAHYSRAPLAQMGASAVFATDFDASAAQLVGALLEHPERTFGEVYASETRYRRDAVTTSPHPLVPGATLLLQRSAYVAGKVDYWYSFAGDPARRPFTTATGSPGTTLSTSAAAPEMALMSVTTPVAPVRFGSAIPTSGVVRGIASSYGAQPGWGSQPTAALPVAYGGQLTHDPQQITVCGDHCVQLPVVDSCPCYFGTAEARVINLSHAAWKLVSDAPLSEGLIPVTVYLRGAPQAARPLQPWPSAATPY
jgi:hypothetical protein